MGFADEVYSLYRDQLADDEEDAIAIVLSILEEQTRKDIIQLIENMNDEEVMQMMGVYLVEMIKMRMVQDGKIPPMKTIITPNRIH